MGRKRFKHINELRVKALAGDKTAAAALEAYTYVPHHLRQGARLDAIHKKIGTTFKTGLHITAKTHKAIRAMVATSIHPDYGIDRLQMLQTRRVRRGLVAA